MGLKEGKSGDLVIQVTLRTGDLEVLRIVGGMKGNYGDSDPSGQNDDGDDLTTVVNGDRR
jgi:hypothetical protein